MEELIMKLDELIIAVNNSSPLCLNIIGIILSALGLIISVIVFVNTCLQHNDNKKLQIYISENDIRMQMHSDFLAIYDSFCLAQNCLVAIKNNVDEFFVTPNVIIKWKNDAEQALLSINQATNRARLFIASNDPEFINALNNILNMYNDIISQISNYINTGEHVNNLRKAWDGLNIAYGIGKENYTQLINSPIAYSNFIKLYANDSTKEISNNIEKLLPYFDYYMFDKHFEQYLQMKIKPFK